MSKEFRIFSPEPVPWEDDGLAGDVWLVNKDYEEISTGSGKSLDEALRKLATNDEVQKLKSLFGEARFVSYDSVTVIEDEYSTEYGIGTENLRKFARYFFNGKNLIESIKK